jgi:hypothetical protein
LFCPLAVQGPGFQIIGRDEAITQARRIEAPVSGTVKEILVAADELAPVGATVAIIATE